MILTKEYLTDAETDINALSVIAPDYWESERYKILKKFCAGAKTILSVGCGPREATITGATHACDITPLSLEHLKKLGWTGIFFISSCDEIHKHLPVFNKKFDVVVCSEVIEHLPTTADVIKTFYEVARVGKKFIITTPNSAVCNPRHQNFTHKQFFTLETLKKIIPLEILPQLKIYTNDIHIYMESN